MLRTRKQNDKFHHYPSLSIMMKSWAFIVIVFFAITLFSFIFYKIINFFGYLLYYYDPLGFYSSAHSSPTFLSNIMYITIYTATNALLILIYAAITCLIHELYELNLNQLEIDFGRTENIRLLKETSIMLKQPLWITTKTKLTKWFLLCFFSHCMTIEGPGRGTIGRQ